MRVPMRKVLFDAARLGDAEILREVTVRRFLGPGEGEGVCIPGGSQL